MENKHKGLSTMLIIAVIILGIGYVGFQTFTKGTLNPQSTQMMNTTANLGNSVFNIAGIIIVIVSIMIGIGAAYYYVSTPERYKKPSKLIDFLNTTTYYFGWGLLSFVVCAIPSYLMYLLWQYTTTEGNVGSFIEVLKWIGIIVIVYFLLAGFGYVIKKKIVDNWRKRRAESQKKVKKIVKSKIELPEGGTI